MILTVSCTLLIGLLVFIMVQYILAISFALRGVPGPPVPSLVVGHLLDLKKARIGTRYNRWARKYGHTYVLRGAMLEPILVTEDPKAINHVLLSKNYERPSSDRVALELFFGRGLFCAEGDEHKRMRKTLHGPFTLQSILEVAHVFFDLADRMKTQWEEELEVSGTGVLDVAKLLHMLSLDAISMTMFKHNLSATKGHIPSLLHKLTNSPGGDYKTVLLASLASMFPLLLRLPSPMKTWADMLRTELGEIAQEVWAGKGDAGMHAKVLETIEAKVGRQPISKDEAVAQIIGILFAGSETVANVVSECFYELAHHQSVQDKLRNELMNFVSTHGRSPTAEDIMNGSLLPYLDAVTHETMRTKAVLMEISRTVVRDDVIPLQYPIHDTSMTEVHVKTGQLINIAVRDGVNVNEEVWGSDAAEFRPERWLEEGLPESVKSIRAQGHVLTFGDGPKVCLGRTFALAEFKVIVSAMIRLFAFEPDSSTIDFYHLGGNTVKPLIRGREVEGVQMPLRVRKL